jgi:hypothetical protein
MAICLAPFLGLKPVCGGTLFAGYRHFRRTANRGEITTYIRIEVRVVPRGPSLGHEAQPDEVAFLLLVVDLLILFST